jgi:hypothetical protein
MRLRPGYPRQRRPRPSPPGPDAESFDISVGPAGSNRDTTGSSDATPDRLNTASAIIIKLYVVMTDVMSADGFCP